MVSRPRRLLAVTSLALAPACGDPPLSNTAGADTAGDDTAGLDTTFAGGDVAAGDSVLQDTASQDTASQDTASQDTAGQDTATGGDTAGDAAADVAQDTGWKPPDIDKSTLELVSSDPADGASLGGVQVDFKLVFSAPVVDAGVQPYTIMVTGPGGAAIEGDFTVKGAEVQFKGKKPAPPYSPIDVLISTIVSGTAGQTMAAPVKLQFHTGGYPDTEPWRKLAERHAPVFWLQTGVAPAKTTDWITDNAPRAIDFAGWDLADTDQHLPNHPAAPPEVAWTVSSTRSHHFIQYVLYWPRKPKTDKAGAFYNDTAGYTVIVRNKPKEQAVGVVTWFKRGQDEQMWAWLRKDNKVLPANAGAGKHNLRGLVADLGHAFLPGGDHQTCLWQYGGDKTWKQCEKHAGVIGPMRFVQLEAAKGDKVVAPSGHGVASDASKPVFKYALTALHEKWWPRRADPKLHVQPMTYSYMAPGGRPKITGTMGSKLVGGANKDFGRPPWAWRWKPTTNVSYYDLPRGTVFFDPAWALYQRLGGKAAGIKDWDAKAAAGFSNDYCFSPVLGIDKRAAAACKGILPP